MATNTPKVTERQMEELITIHRVQGKSVNWAGSSCSVLDALVKKGLIICTNPNHRPQFRSYRVTDSGRELLKPYLEEQARLKAARAAESDKHQAAIEESIRAEAAREELAKLAPELLAALKELVRVAVIDSGKGRDDEGYAAFRVAREVIERAEKKVGQ